MDTAEKQGSKKWFLPILWGLLLLLGWAFLGKISQPKTGKEVVKTQAYDFNLPRLDQTGFMKLSDGRNQVRLVVFWATWCSPCLAEIPTLNNLQEELGAQGFQIFSISLDEEAPTVIPAFLAQNPVHYPVLQGNETLVQKYGNFQGIPSSFLIDRQGNIIEAYPGLIAEQTLRDRIRIALREPQKQL